MRGRVLGVAALAALISLYVAVAASASATSHLKRSTAPPRKDPFYSWSRPLAKVAPGTILRRRTVALKPAVGGVSTATQVLYRTTSELGKPAVTVATVIEPSNTAGTKLVSYQTAYDALGGQCDPSYTLPGGNGSSDSAETVLMGQFVASGDAVVVSDYEGENLAFGAGRQSGYATLDGIRAAESVLHRSDPIRVGMIGYSGGSIATEFAAELAPKYAPDVKLVGAAAGGVPVDLADNLHYVDGSPVWSSTIPGIIDGVSRAFGANFKPFANAHGRKLMRAVSGQCLGQYLGKYPGLTAAKIFKPKFKNVLRIPAWATMSNRLIMGTAGTPKVPMLLGVGNSDGTGDGVMVANDVAGLAQEYCGRGVNVTFHEYTGDDHEQAAPPFLLASVPFLNARLNGRSVPNGCDAVPKGNLLKPLPVPRYRMTLGRSNPHGSPAKLRATGGVVDDGVLTLTRGDRKLQTIRLRHVGARPSAFTLKLLKAGRYLATLRQAGVPLWRIPIRVRVSGRSSG